MTAPWKDLPKKFRDALSHARLIQPVSAYGALLAKGDGGNFRENWPANLVAVVGGEIYQNMTCLSAWKLIPYNSVAAVLDTIRTRVLSFSLEIEAEAPDAGEAAPNAPPLPQDRVSQVFNTYISGSVQNVSTGSSQLNQNVSVNSGVSDQLFATLLAAIAEANGPAAAKTEIAAAVTAMEEGHGSPGFTDTYNRFISVLADHIQVFGPLCAPYLPELRKLLP
jgi:hypothetical protein